MIQKRNAILLSSVILFFVSSVAVYLYSCSLKDRSANDSPTTNMMSVRNLISVDLSRDVGRVLCGEIIRERIPIKNISGRRLHLQIAGTSCSCTEASFADEDLDPGAETFISVRMDISKKWKKGIFKGTVAFQIRDSLSDNTPKQSSIETLEIMGQIDPNEGLVPTTVDFGKVRPRHGTITKDFEISLDPSLDLHDKVAKWETNLKYLDMNLARTLGTQGSTRWRGSISLDSNMLPPREKIEETFNTTIQFPFESKGENHLLSLNIIGSIGNFVESSPSTLYWNRNNYDKDITLLLDAVGKAKITVKNVSCAEKLLSFKIVDDETSCPKIVVTQNYDATKGGVLRAQVRIEVFCEQESSYVLVVPVLII